MNEKVIVREQVNQVIVSAQGSQGPRGNTILNGSGAPANNLGLQNDFYLDITTSRFYGPKLSDATWSGANSFLLAASASVQDHRHTYDGEIDQTYDPN
jgi:hypothetical protein